MFGVIPRPLWEKKMPPDARNRITLSMNCLLIETAGQRILVETGAGNKQDAKFRDIYGLDGPHLIDGLRRYGVSAEDIDVVIDTHLHFDHCGGNTVLAKDKVIPAFPNARYIVQRGEYEHGFHPTERDRASYSRNSRAAQYGRRPDPCSIARQSHCCRGWKYRCPGAYREYAVRQTYRRRQGQAFFLPSLVPTTAHLPLPWIMGYDLYPMIHARE